METQRQRNVNDIVNKALQNNEVIKHPNNEVYELMKESFIHKMGKGVEVDNVVTLVECKGKVKLYESEKCSISLPTGSHLNFTSYGNNIDISRVISNSKGDGKILLTVVIGIYKCVMDQNPHLKSDLILECIGSVGMGNNLRNMDIKDQTSVFRSFGFRKYGKYDPTHIYMKLDMTTDDFNKRIKDLGI